MRPGLIDRYTLVIHPITLGSGHRMFEGPAPLTKFSLTGSVTTSVGVIVAYYDRGKDRRRSDPVSAEHLPARRPAPGPGERWPRSRPSCTNLNKELHEQGSWVFAGGLHPPDTATVVRAGGLITDGPYLEGKEHIGGSMADHRRGPGCGARLGRQERQPRPALPIEIRPFQDVSPL